MERARARERTLLESRGAEAGWEISACKRLIGEDRKELISTAEGANQFASKRAAHSVPGAEVRTKFRDLDQAIDTLKKLAEKYTLILSCETLERLEPAHRAGIPTIYPLLAQMKDRDLLDQMKSDKLEKGWDSIFLEPWADEETLALPLGDMEPPDA